MTQQGFTIRRAHILVRLDANHVIGLAHAIRVAAILNLLTEPYQLSIVGNGDLIGDFFQNHHHYLIEKNRETDFFSQVDEVHPDVVLVDHPRPGSNFWSKLRGCKGTFSVVAIDDEGGGVEADIIFNGTVLESYHHYPLANAQARVLLGPAYTLIRPEFRLTPWKNPDKSCVVIVVGSGDIACKWALYLVSGNLNLRGWGAVRMIVGRAFPEMNRLQHNCDVLGVSLSSGLTGQQMANVLSQASVALITGGMIVYEALAVGVPAVVFPQIQNLIPEAKWFAQRGCIVDLGYENGMDINLVSKSVDKLLESSSDRVAMSNLQRAVIDGHGMGRAAAEIDGLLRKHYVSTVQHFDKNVES